MAVAGAMLLDIHPALWRLAHMDLACRVRVRRHVGKVPHASDESIPVTGDGYDEIMLVGRLTERASQRRYLTRQVVFVDGGVGPHPVQELVFADDVVSMLEQHDEHVERLRGEGYETTVAP